MLFLHSGYTRHQARLGTTSEYGAPDAFGPFWIVSGYLQVFTAASLTLALSWSSAHAAGSLIQSAINRDGSELRLVSNINKSEERKSVDVLYRKYTKDPLRLLGNFELPRDSPERGRAHLFDWDRDGNYEVQIISECGAGPNCEGVLYRLDKPSGKLIAFFNTGGADVQLIDGHLVESARDNCCSWVANAYKFDANRYLVKPEPAFTITIEHLGDSRAKAPVMCTFSIETTQGQQIIAPPAKSFLRLCRHYGEKYVVAKK